MRIHIRAAVVLLIVTCVASGSSGRKKTRDKPSTGRHSRNKLDRILLEDNTCSLDLSCKGDGVELPVKFPVRGPPGVPGLPGEKGEPGEAGLPGIPGARGMSAQLPARIAFFVGLSDNMGPVTKHTDIVFDRVVTNIGNGYDVSTGHFTAPVNGTYQFNVIVSAQGRQKAAVMILKNGGMIATVWAESIPYWATASNVAILSLDKGDQVWLMLNNRASYVHGYMYTTFSGYLIFENN